MPDPMPAIEREDETAVQEMLDHENPCFGCGPNNPEGLRIKSYPDPDGNGLVADYEGEAHLAGSAGVLGGGPQATLIDCHGIWTATWHSIQKGDDPVAHYVTAGMELSYKRPTPLTDPIRLVSTIDQVDGRRVHVEVDVVDEDGNVCTQATVVCHRLDDDWGSNPLPTDGR